MLTVLPPAVRGVLVAAVAYALVFAVCQRVYKRSTGKLQMADSCYSLLVSDNLWRNGTPRLDGVLPTDPAGWKALPGYVPEFGRPYHLQYIPGDGGGPSVVYGYPLGSSLFSVGPVVWYASRGFSVVAGQGVYDFLGESEVQRRMAASVVAVAAVLSTVLARYYFGWALSLLFGFGMAFTTPYWSTMSRAMWSHNWLVLQLLVAIILLVRLSRAGRLGFRAAAPTGLALGVLLVGLYFTRPQCVSSIAGIGLYLLWRQRWVAGWTAVSSLAGVGAVVLACQTWFNQSMPPSGYSTTEFHVEGSLARLAAILVSPSRGLFVFCPVLLVALGWLATSRRYLRDADLLLPTAAALLGQVVLIASFVGWHAGWCFGPRHFCDVLPWLLLFTLQTTRAAIDHANAATSWTGKLPLWIGTAAVGACLMWGLFVHGRGANAEELWLWNERFLREDPLDASFDWRNPIFLTGINHTVAHDGRVTPLDAPEAWRRLGKSITPGFILR